LFSLKEAEMIVDRWSDMRGIQIKRTVALAAAAALLAIVALAIVAGIIINIYNGTARTE
jgi:diacylglycerol kinase